ncbi:MAG TPA: hypothetical protein VMX96_04315 [Dehalococcoidia bacterium]|nr:hypothetical protein [Dehalococcoidia bacterium]
MGTKKWLTPLAIATVLTVALAVPLLSLNAALADPGDITKSDSPPYNGEILQMTIDMDVLTPTVTPGGQVQYTINVSNLGPLTDGLGNLPPGVDLLDGAINVSIWAELPAFFTYASTGTVIEWGGATRHSTEPTPGDTSPLWSYWDIPGGGGVLIPFTANVLPGIPPGTYDANAFASGDNFGPIDDEGPTGQDLNTPPGEDPEPDEDVTVGYPVGGIVEPVGPLELAATPGEPSDEASTVISIALGIGIAVLFAAFLVWSLRRRRVISAGKSQ